MSSKEKWTEAAKKELGGKDPFETLTGNWNEFKILPYYDYSDLSSDTNSIAGNQPSRGGTPNGWLNLPLIDLDEAKDSNSVALDHLLNGADGVFFKITQQREISQLLAEIKPEFCFLGFEASSKSNSFFEKLAASVSPTQLNGAIFWAELPERFPIANLFKGYKNFRCLGIDVNGDGVVQPLSQTLTEAIEVMDHLTDYAFSAEAVFNQLAFNVSATKNFIGDIVRIRSLRILISRLAQAYGLENAKSFIRVEIEAPDLENYQPHGDMLFNSFATLAAVAASADAITVTTSNSKSSLHSRTARNISLLLKEESRLDKVVDPFAGSYVVESLTTQVVNKVWANLTQGS